jgi:hypothetical protein
MLYVNWQANVCVPCMLHNVLAVAHNLPVQQHKNISLQQSIAQRVGKRPKAIPRNVREMLSKTGENLILQNKKST